MLTILTRRVVPKHFRCFKSHLFKKSPDKSINKHIRSDNYSNAVALSKFNSPRMLINRVCMSTNNLNLQEKIIFTDQLNDKEKFSDLLKTVQENQNNLSLDFLMSIIPEMISILDDLLLEDEHKEELTKSEPFIRLLDAVQDSVNDMSARDLVNFLLLCKRLNIPYKINPYVKAIDKLNDIYLDLKFHELCICWHVLPQFMNKSKNLRNLMKMRIADEISNESHLESPDDLIGALVFLANRWIKPESWEKIGVLKGIIELEELDSNLIFKHYLTLFVRISPHHKLGRPMKEQYYKRIREEVTNNNYLASFIANYGHVVSLNLLDYDQKLVDDVVNKMMEKELKTNHIKILCQTLSQLKHCHYEFVKYLIDFVKKNPNVFGAYPKLSSRIIPIIAMSNCNQIDKNRWGSSLLDLNNSPGLAKVAESLREKFDRYFYFLIELASLNIFLDEELKYVCKLVSDSENLTDYYAKLLKFFLLLDQAVKCLHPSFSRTILSNFNASLIIKELKNHENETQKRRKNILSNIGKCLETSTGVQNCLLMNCPSKSNIEINGIVGVNKDGQLLDFSVLKNDNETLYMEDIASLTDYKLIALTFISEDETSRNTLDLNAAWALGVKMQEKLGFQTFIFYETVWHHLTGDKGNFIHNKIVQEAKK